MSEMSSQFDFFREGPQTGVNPSIRGKSSPLDQNTSAGGTNTHQTIPFMLSPLNEFDEEYENPLNKAMIIDHTATGFTWTKRKEEHSTASSNPNILLSSDGDLLIKDESIPHEIVLVPPNPFKLKEAYDDLNHSF
jgi:hypothetical protein